MGTNTYFDEAVTDAATDREFHFEVGTSGFAGEGPQMYLTLGDVHVILSHEDAKKFCKAVADVGFYFQYS